MPSVWLRSTWVWLRVTEEAEAPLYSEGMAFTARPRQYLDDLGGADTLSMLLVSREFDDRLVVHDQTHRDLASKHWRWGRRQLSLLSAGIRAEIEARWNASSIPPDAHYFADFVRRELRARGLLNELDA